MRPAVISAAALLVLCCTAVAGWGQQPSEASRADDLVVKLVTIGPADPIYTWWGHSALIVEDSRLGTSRFYNYGLFSFEQDNFLLNFVMGRLWFQVGASDSDRELAFYRYLGRRISIQTLNLLPEKRLEMALFLENNILPRNRTYLYDHYYDNCATRVRDLIDIAVDGQLAEATADRGRMTLREHTQRFTSQSYFMDWLLMFLMSEVIDHPITRWEEMFLPSELESNVAALRYRDDSGRERSLVSETDAFYNGPGQRRIPERAGPTWPRALIPALIPALLALLLAFLIRRGGAGRKTAWRLLGIHSALFALILGLLGSALFFMSTFTDHTVTYGNENLFVASPLVLAAIPVGLAAAISGRKRSRRLLQLIWLLLAAAAVVYLLLKAVLAFDQRNAAALAAILPILFGFAAAAGLSWKSA